MATEIEFIVTQENLIEVTTEQNTIEIEFGQVLNTSVVDHDLLNNLDYENSGHTGFASSAEVVKITGDQEISGDKTFNNNVYVKGDLQVDGDVNFINSNNVNIGDNIITLNADIPDDAIPTQDAGIQVKRGTEPTTGIYWKEDVDQWKVDNYKIAIEGDTLDGGTW